jgi:hypothetical protein
MPRRLLLVYLVYFAMIGAGALTLATRAWNSVTHYESHYFFREKLPAGPPLSERVVLLVLDGIRADVAREMPRLQELAARGASGIAVAAEPSLSAPGRAVLATGTWPEVNGVTNNLRYETPRIDSIFSLAQTAGLPRAVAGSYFWERAFQSYLDGPVLQFEKELDIGLDSAALAAWQAKTCAGIESFLAKQPKGLLLADLTAADPAGHDFGGESEEYRKAALAVDACLGTLVGALDDGKTTFIAVADHGQVDRRGQGGHGGAEDEVLNVPLVLAGAAIRRTSGFQVPQIEIAPTICALLGLPLPSANQGVIIWDALDIPEDAALELRAREREQRRIANSHLPSREQGRAAERDARALSTIVFWLLLTLVGVWAVILRHQDRGFILLMTLVYYAVYYALFWLFGLGYSLSAIGREEYTNGFLGLNALAALLACIVVGALAARRTPFLGHRLAFDTAAWLTVTLGLQISVIHYQWGLIMVGFVPNLSASFKGYLDLIQLMVICFLTVPFLIAAAFFSSDERGFAG